MSVLNASYETLSLSLEDEILTVTLNRPERLNAFNVTMSQEAPALLEAADADDAVRALIVTGAGRGFCAGMDLGDGLDNAFGLDESVDPLGPEAEAIRDLGGVLTLRLFRMKKPVIAAINGPAVGIGATMTLPMDGRILSEKARVGFVFAKLGICLEACSSWFLPRLVGMERALEWGLSGDILSAEEAFAGGFGAKVVSPDDLLPTARAYAARLIKGTSAVSVAVNRQLLWRMAGAAHPMEAHRLDSRAMLALSMGDGKEGVAAFGEKRPPRFASRVSAGAPLGFDWDSEPPFLKE
ncbi:MAG: enoyl-CoA hydratase-related protein [Pseudomonadota bacterium]